MPGVIQVVSNVTVARMLPPGGRTPLVTSIDAQGRIGSRTWMAASALPRLSIPMVYAWRAPTGSTGSSCGGDTVTRGVRSMKSARTTVCAVSRVTVACSRW